LEVAQREGNYEQASRLRFSVIPSLQAKLPNEAASETVEHEGMMIRDRVTSEDIARVVAKSTGIPVANLLKGERERLVHVSSTLARS
jgi:ATP-dependent Clp protease ATP-binding subunit ClpB